MSILIKGMSKPKTCDDCIVPLSKCDYLQKRADNCPLIEIDLVRCGECKWWDRKDKESPFGYCHAEKHCHFSKNWEICIYRTYKADHFCADGERRADE